MRTAPIYFWDEKEMRASLNAIIIGEITFLQKHMTCKFGRMRDRRGTFATINIIDAPKSEKSRFRLKRSYESLKEYRGQEFQMLANMRGWDDCPRSEWWKLDEILNQRKENPPLPPDIFKELGI